MGFLDQRQPANSRAHECPDSLCIGLCNLKARILNRLKTSRNPIMNKGVHVPRLFGGQIGFNIKVFDFASEVDRQATVVKLCNGCDPGLASNQR